jgi:hypothetical protein
VSARVRSASQTCEGHFHEASVVPADVLPPVGRRSLSVMSGGLSLLVYAIVFPIDLVFQIYARDTNVIRTREARKVYRCP